MEIAVARCQKQALLSEEELPMRLNKKFDIPIRSFSISPLKSNEKVTGESLSVRDERVKKVSCVYGKRRR